MKNLPNVDVYTNIIDYSVCVSY